MHIDSWETAIESLDGGFRVSAIVRTCSECPFVDAEGENYDPTFLCKHHDGQDRNVSTYVDQGTMPDWCPAKSFGEEKARS